MENYLIKEKSALQKCLQQFRIDYEEISCICGSTYNLYKLIPKPGDKVSKIKALQEDITISLNCPVRIVIQDDSIGIEIPHKKEDREIVDYATLDSKYYGGGEQYDEMFKDAATIAVTLQAASISLLQRKINIGFARASRIIDQLEQAGIIGEMIGSSPRKVLVSNLSELIEKLGTS